MVTIDKIRVIAGGGWRGWDRISDRQATKHGIPRGSIVNPREPSMTIYSPSRQGGYDNTGFRAGSLDRH